MFARLLATVAALLLACASPQAHAYAQADLVQSALDLKTALPARATAKQPASGEITASTHWRVYKNLASAPECASAHKDYANNNPMKFVDPDGRHPIVIAAGEACAATPACWVTAGALVTYAAKPATDYVAERVAAQWTAGTLNGIKGMPLPVRTDEGVINDTNGGGDEVTKPIPEAPYPNNPDNSDFDRINSGKGAKLNPEDGSVWERDKSQHGSRDGDGDQWKRWPDKRSWEKGEKPKSIWPDGRVRK